MITKVERKNHRCKARLASPAVRGGVACGLSSERLEEAKGLTAVQ